MLFLCNFIKISLFFKSLAELVDLIEYTLQIISNISVQLFALVISKGFEAVRCI